MRAGSAGSTPEKPTLKKFLDLLESGVPDPQEWESLLKVLEAEQLAEEALALCRRRPTPSGTRKDPRWPSLRGRLESAAERSRLRRAHQWQLDPARRTLRFQFEVRPPASELNPSGLHRTLVALFQQAGLPLAVGLEKSPRPLVTLGPPLPPGIPGLGEWVDCGLREPSPVPAEHWPERLAPHCPAGLAFTGCTIIPNHSTPLVELAREARWRWDCPEPLLPSAHQRLGIFEQSTTFQIEKTGKVDGRKVIKRVEVRSQVLGLEWQGSSLFFSLRMEPGEALGAAKLLGGILGVEPGQITGLTRVEVLLGQDLRLVQGQKYETKLHNIYEDAVLLESDALPPPLEDDDDLLLER